MPNRWHKNVTLLDSYMYTIIQYKVGGNSLQSSSMLSIYISWAIVMLKWDIEKRKCRDFEVRVLGISTLSNVKDFKHTQNKLTSLIHKVSLDTISLQLEQHVQTKLTLWLYYKREYLAKLSYNCFRKRYPSWWIKQKK